MRRRIRQVVQWISQAAIDPRESPDRVAAAYALGVFFGFSPFLGFQIVVSFALAYALGLNRPLVFLGLSTNLPWVMVPWYVGTTAAAAKLLGLHLGDETMAHLTALLNASIWQAAFWRIAADMIETMLWPYLLGPTVGAAILAAAAFVIVRRFGRRSRRRHAGSAPATQ